MRSRPTGEGGHTEYVFIYETLSRGASSSPRASPWSERYDVRALELVANWIRSTQSGVRNRKAEWDDSSTRHRHPLRMWLQRHYRMDTLVNPDFIPGSYRVPIAISMQGVSIVYMLRMGESGSGPTTMTNLHLG
jgi:hypothetical protein